MPGLADWPKVLASAAEAVLSVPDIGYRMPVHAHPPRGFDALPCIVVEPGDGGLWLQPSSGGGMSTLGQWTAAYSVRVVVGDPGDWQAMEYMADAVQRLLVGFADQVAADVDADGVRPAMSGDVLTPTAEEYAAVPTWYARLPLTVPIPKITPTP